MKRTILASVSAVALTLAAGSAMAQDNTAAITQVGLSQQAEIVQSNTLSSEATIGQTGADNWAKVQQGANSENNVANVTQTGTDVAPVGVPQSNSPYSQMLSNIADVVQNGDNGQVDIEQTGNNRAQVTQAYAPGEGQISAITQTSVGAMPNTENYAATAQRGTAVEADIDQSGEENRAETSQAGGASDSLLVVSQTGDSNDAYVNQDGASFADTFVTQMGNGNFAESVQTGVGAFSAVTQTGNGNEADVRQSGSSTSGITQTGNSNQASANQTGSGNTSTITQTGNSNNVGVADQSPAGPVLADAGLIQNGSNNASTISQTANGASALVEQQGSGNDSVVTQTAASSADVLQAGVDNDSLVTQNGAGATAIVSQTGDNSDSIVTQLAGGDVVVNQSGATGSTSTVTTEADSSLAPPANTVLVNQTDTGAGPSLGQANVSTVIQDNVNLGSSVIVDQTHNVAGEAQNSSFVRQGRNASNGDVIISQNGGDNVSNYTSTTATDNDASVTQTGVNNNSDVQQDFQNGSASAVVNQNGVGGADNSVFIDQISAGFATNPVQFALGASAAATQDGEGNLSTISQTGFADTAIESNFASSAQFGDFNTSTIGQSGVDNSASLTQTGDLNTSTIMQSGDGNTASVMQLSNGNISTVTQSGTSGAATVNQ